jgi:hypothetical protein
VELKRKIEEFIPHNYRTETSYFSETGKILQRKSPITSFLRAFKWLLSRQTRILVKNGSVFSLVRDKSEQTNE